MAPAAALGAWASVAAPRRSSPRCALAEPQTKDAQSEAYEAHNFLFSLRSAGGPRCGSSVRVNAVARL